MVRVLTEVETPMDSALKSPAFCWDSQVAAAELMSPDTKARQVPASLTRKPSPRPVREAETRMSPRTAKAVANEPCPATRLALVISN